MRAGQTVPRCCFLVPSQCVSSLVDILEGVVVNGRAEELDGGEDSDGSDSDDSLEEVVIGAEPAHDVMLDGDDATVQLDETERLPAAGEAIELN